MSNEEMKSKLDGFKKTYSDFMMGNIDDEELAKDTTQPFWQSMYLSKKRLESNDIEEDIKVTSETTLGIDNISTDSTDKCIVGIYREPVIEEKILRRNGKKIYNYKGKKVCIGSVIKPKQEGNMVACPNCGNMGEISSYINGCDYCNSKFQVEDLEEKISSYMITEDNKEKVKTIGKRFFIGSFATGAVLAAAFVFSIFAMIIQTMINPDRVSFIFGLMFVVPILVLPVFIPLFIVVLIVLGIIILRAAFAQQSERIEVNSGYYAVKSVKGINREKFIQNLEYKLRNIHFAENSEEISAFVSFIPDKLVESYKDVIECSLYKATFEHISEVDGRYIMNFSCIMLVSRLKNGRVKEESEKVTLELSKKTDVPEQNLETLRLYTCPSCGSSINMLNGGRCDYCGKKLDYENYDWIIDKYYSNINEKQLKEVKAIDDVAVGKRKYKDPFKKIKIEMIAGFIASIIIGLVAVFLVNKSTIMFLVNEDKYIQILEDKYDELPELSDIYPDIELKDEKYDDFERTYTYSNTDTYMSDEYLDKLLNEYGYKKDTSEGNMKSVVKLYKLDKYVKAYITVTVEQKNDETIVKFVADEKRDYEDSKRDDDSDD